MFEILTDTLKAIAHDFQANQALSTEEKLRQEFGWTGQVGQQLRENAAYHQTEAAILRKEITPVNKEYID